MTEKPDTTKPFLLRRENRYLWFALILPAYLLAFAWVEAVIPVEAWPPHLHPSGRPDSLFGGVHRPLHAVVSHAAGPGAVPGAV